MSSTQAQQPPQKQQEAPTFHPVPSKELRSLAEVDAIMSSPEHPCCPQRKLVDGRLIWTYKNSPKSARDFWRGVVQSFGHRPYVAFNDKILTYSQVSTQVDLCARWLRLHFGVRKGDRVGLIARNMPEFVVTLWACHLLGAVFVPINAFGEGDLLAFCIGDVDCRVVICDVERLDRLEAFLPQLLSMDQKKGKSTAALQALVVIGRKADEVIPPSQRKWANGQMKGVQDWDELNALYAGPAMDKLCASLIDEEIPPEDNATILFTSGTTSKPKGVLSTQSQHLACLFLAKAGVMRAYHRRRYALPDPLNDANAARMLCLVPLFHTTGLQSGVLGATSSGACLHLMSAWNLHKAIALIEKYQITNIVGIGFMVREIIMTGTRTQLASLTSVAHGGSSASKSLPAETQSSRPGALVGIGYGLTEVNGVAAALAADDYVERPDSTGLPPPGVELIVVDPDTLTAVPNGSPGELWIRGPGVAKGYWGRPEATAEAFLPDGWFRSGDLARIDAEGFVYILDRVKDMIIRGGENISCPMVENAVYQHPSVQECAAVAFPCPRLGERVAVVVQPKPGSTTLPSEREILEVAAKQLPKFARPEYIWIRREELPHNPSGKVLKADLRKEVKARIDQAGGVQKVLGEREAKL